MSTKVDYLPENPALFGAWMKNWSIQLPKFAAKYSITAAELEQTEKDNAWSQHWVKTKIQTEMFKKQVNEYFRVMTDEPNKPAPTRPVLTAADNFPEEVSPGIRRRVRDIASKIKGQKAIYNEADGELLGIIATKKMRPATPKPEFEVTTLTNFRLLVVFIKAGFKSIRFEIQQKGGAWRLGMIFTKSPGEFEIPPTIEGISEQVFVRAIYLENDQPVGEYSDIKPAFIAP